MRCRKLDIGSAGDVLVHHAAMLDSGNRILGAGHQQRRYRDGSNLRAQVGFRQRETAGCVSTSLAGAQAGSPVYMVFAAPARS